MTLWNKTNRLPKYLTRVQKRNVVVTNRGFVYNWFKNGAIKRQEILETITGLSNTTSWGSPKIMDVWHEPTAALLETKSALTGTVAKAGGVSNTLVNGTGTAFTTQLAVNDYIRIATSYFRVGAIANSTRITVSPATTSGSATAYKVTTPTVNTWISFSEPISQAGLAGKTKMTVANTISGNNIVGRTANTRVFNLNRLLYRWRPIVPGTYKVQAQTIGNSTATASNTRSTNSGTEAVSFVVSGTVSNTTGTLVYTQS